MEKNKFFKKPTSDGSCFKTGANLKKTSGVSGIAASGGKGLAAGSTLKRPSLKGFGKSGGGK